MQDMHSLLQDILHRQYGTIRKSKRKVSLDWLLDQTIQEQYSDRSDYELSGGFAVIAAGIQKLVEQCVLTPIRTSPKSFKPPYIHTSYWLAENGQLQDRWNSSAMLRLRERLDLTYYENRPEEQTDSIWTFLERVYEFMKTAHTREVITREERSLELFDNEKWLSEPEGIRFLRSIQVTLDDLRADHAWEPFVYYVHPKRDVQSILIVENKSIFHTCKRMMREGRELCGLAPDMLIYGEGWKIESSLLFLEELNIDPTRTALYYAGDMDLTGWDIYGKIKLHYLHLNMHLALPFYQQMMLSCKSTYPYTTEQSCQPEHLELIRNEVAFESELSRFFHQLLENQTRVPQEVLNYEVMARLAER